MAPYFIHAQAMMHGVQKKKGKGGMNDALLEKERDQLANALERLADVQRELAEGQRSLMTGPLLCPLYLQAESLPAFTLRDT